MATALIGIGSNLGDGLEAVRQSLALLDKHPNIYVTRRSRSYRTNPVGGPCGQNVFFNAAAVLQTSLQPRVLLKILHDVEFQLGRTRGDRWGPRLLDLDLLLLDGEVARDQELTLPHPRMSFRRFVLEPAAEIAAEMYHPVCGATVGELLDHLNTQPHYVAIGGPRAAGKTTLASWLQAHAGCPAVLEPQSPNSLPHAAGPRLAAELELTEQRARRLDPHSWWNDPPLRERLRPQCHAEPESKPPPAAVSDFWFGQAGVIASLNSPKPDAPLTEKQPYYALLGCLSHYRYRLITRKLLIWLDPPSEPLVNRLCAAEAFPHREAAIAWVERFRKHMSDMLGTLIRGPLLRLETDDMELIKTEAAAALEAIQPLDGACCD